MSMSLGSASSPEPEVMMDINTTPLIDVMLVLLVMLIITIPIQLHSVDLNMPLMDGATLVGNHRNPAASTALRASTTRCGCRRPRCASGPTRMCSRHWGRRCRSVRVPRYKRRNEERASTETPRQALHAKHAMTIRGARPLARPALAPRSDDAGIDRRIRSVSG